MLAVTLRSRLAENRKGALRTRIDAEVYGVCIASYEPQEPHDFFPIFLGPPLMEFIYPLSQGNGPGDAMKELAMVRMDRGLKNIGQFGRHGSHGSARERFRCLLPFFGLVVHQHSPNNERRDNLVGWTVSHDASSILIWFRAFPP